MPAPFPEPRGPHSADALFVTPEPDPGDAMLVMLTEIGERLSLRYNSTHDDDLTIVFDVVTPTTPDRSSGVSLGPRCSASSFTASMTTPMSCCGGGRPMA
jgi:hypothetical protein